MNALFGLGIVAMPCVLLGQGAVSLPEYTVHSLRIANQAPAGTFVMPVSALRFEPQVDIQSRNLAEGQADVTLRGGIFENTGFQIGAATLLDPQTGHYFSEIPVAPALLDVPQVLTGAALTLGASNATAGTIRYGWRPIRTGGSSTVGFGRHRLNRQEFYQGYLADKKIGGMRPGVDLALARSESRGPVAYGDHQFERANLRVQLTGAASQTDFVAGYQAKFFGWPNMYTPFNSNESEDLQTALFAVNHRTELGGGDFLEAAAYHRRNKDDYAFNRFAPVGPVHPFQHTTWVRAAAVGGRRTIGAGALNARAEVLADELRSTSLTFGRYHTRSIARFSLVPEMSWRMADGGRTVVQAGASFDDTNRDQGHVAPVVEVAREFAAKGLRRFHASYTETSQVPTYTALNASSTAGLFRGNPDLGRARSRNLEFGAAGTVADWTVTGTIFWRHDHGLVDWTFRRGVTARTASAVDIDVTGFETLARRAWAACDLVVGYTYLAKDADYRGALVEASFYALNFARHRLTAAFTWRLGHGFELRLDNVARVQARNLLRVTGGNQAVTSACGIVYRPESLEGWEISVQADNLWGGDFQEIPAVPATPRQISAGLAIRW